ncbi:MAG: amidohydrolase, partial [Sedimenticola sp.]|nr:amidohydrolase [Sedimenticola sp.]
MTETATGLRHELHRHPELSGRESTTAQRVTGFFRNLQPDRMLQGLGGEGLAFVFACQAPGPRVLLRCDMDALPIQESEPLPHRSRRPGVSHKCGHDGHMAIMAAVGEALARRRPARGEVVLLYQPAEETGQGARAVLDDPRFESVNPDLCFALHNIPGYPLGQVLVRDGAFSCASRGMAIKLSGKTAHAAQPETGRSPAAAMCRIIEQLSNLPPELLPPHELAFATVVGSRLGEKA